MSVNISDKDLTLEALGLEKPSASKTSTTVSKTPKKEEGLQKVDDAMQNAAATAALKAAINANSELAIREASKAYVIEKKKHMLNRCKDDEEVEFVGQKIFANYFGPVYTFLYNTVPVTVRFDGSKQMFPKFVYKRLMEKLNEVSDSNTSKVEIEDRTK